MLIIGPQPRILTAFGPVPCPQSVCNAVKRTAPSKAFIERLEDYCHRQSTRMDEHVAAGGEPGTFVAEEWS